MKAYRKILLVLGLLVLGMGAAMAHGRASFGVYVGPAWGPWWYPAPMYYPPQPVVVVRPEPPPVYIEQPAAQVEAPAPAPAQQYWYYCRGAKAYYPYVKECPEGWQKVLPQPER